MEQMADNPDIDVVYVVTPNALHAEHTIKAAKAGKHVLCEKPMEVSSEKCQQMIDACKKAGKQLAIGYRLHFEPNNLECVRLAREKVFGDLKLIQADFGFRIGDPTQWRLNRALAGGGPLMDVGVYALQATRYITGEEPTMVTAVETTNDHVKFKDVEESIAWQLKFPSGIIATSSSTYNFNGMNRCSKAANCDVAVKWRAISAADKACTASPGYSCPPSWPPAAAAEIHAPSGTRLRPPYAGHALPRRTSRTARPE